MFQIKAKILYNNRVSGNYYHCAVSASRIAACASPGQFVNIKVSQAIEPLLRRPLGIHRVRGSGIEILYEVLGPGTRILSQKKPGEYLDIIGSLGTGFDYVSPRHHVTTSPILVGGGMGVAPLTFLAEKLGEVQSSKFKVQSLVLLGAKTEKHILCEKEFKKLGCDVRIATDDGSRGYKGYVSGLLKNILRTPNSELRTIYACGPKPMLKEISRLSKEYNIPAQISLEEHMACGIGACLGCVVNTKKGYKRVCKDGPVFNADEIIW
jgi:dihydroorotate dehydrogenase electron transfer subunit